MCCVPCRSRVSYSQDRHLFHVLISAGITYLCMADEAFGRRAPFSYLDEVRSRFLGMYGAAAASALAYAYNTEFSRILQQQADYFSSGAGAAATDPLARASKEMADVKTAMVENIDAVLDRGEKIELLVDKARPGRRADM